MGRGAESWQFSLFNFCKRKSLSLLVLTFLPKWHKISSSYQVPVPNYWTWTKTTPQKKQFLWSNLYKIELMITSLAEILEFANLGCMTIIIGITWLFFAGDVMDKNFDVINFFSKTIYFKKAWASHFWYELEIRN